MLTPSELGPDLGPVREPHLPVLPACENRARPDVLALPSPSDTSQPSPSFHCTL